jgi:DNA polymerase III epsilon subunit-like protein
MSRNIVVDVEADGPVPGLYSMISFGAVIVEPGFQRTFYAELRPISEEWNPQALAVSGFSREKTLTFPDPRDAMQNFDLWLTKNIQGRPIFHSDNNGFDFSFINYYFWRYLNRNPFGWSSSNIGSYYKGLTGNVHANFRHLRDTAHTHNPVDDARGNAEALLKMFKMSNYKKEPV